MGIRLLNNLIRTKAKQALKTINIHELSGKKIAIDTSIYIYRFIKEKELISSFYIMCSLFRKYDITPIFVFDGKPPPEKKSIISERKTIRIMNEEKLAICREKYKSETDETKLEEYKNTINELEKKTARLKVSDVQKVKSLIRHFGMSYVDAHGEADELCASLCKREHVYACLSEDMDMFVYGCPRVLRYLSLLNKECVIYNLSDIYKYLSLTANQFKIMCILAGTDYMTDTYDMGLNVYEIYDLIMRTNIMEIIERKKEYEPIDECLGGEKYDILCKNVTENIDKLHEISEIFNGNEIDSHTLKIENTEYNKEKLIEFLKKYYIYIT